MMEGLVAPDDSKVSEEDGAEASMRGTRGEPHGAKDKPVAGIPMNTHCTAETSCIVKIALLRLIVNTMVLLCP